MAITVDTLADGIGVPGTTLREAIDVAAPGDTIQFSVTGQIQLGIQGQLFINKELTIEGPGPSQLTIRAFDPSPTIKNGDGRRVFLLDSPSGVPTHVTISGVTLTGADSNVSGGAILSRSNLLLVNSVVTGNATTSGGISGGAGIFSDNGPAQPNSLTIRDSAIISNSAPFAEGGGVRARFGSLVVERSTISGNFAGTVGGGISASDGGVTVLLKDSTVHSNNAITGGGGIFLASATATITNSTISGNQTPANGAGVDSVQSNVSLRFSTVTNNRVSGTGDGGGVYVSGTSALTVDHSVVSGNFDGSICFPPPLGCAPFPGDITGSATARYSVIGIQSGGTLTNQGGNIFGLASLDPLSDNGGPTPTHRPRAGSPVINAGDPDAVPNVNGVPLHDQRGAPFARIADGRIDIGAVEDQAVLAGDFDFDSDLDGDDIDLLVDAIAHAGSPAIFDLTNDGLVNLLDRDEWLALAGALNLPSGSAYLLGDANLDGAVDGSDFGAWNANKFTSVAQWTRGDFNADGVVDGSDFGTWNANKFQSVVATSRPSIIMARGVRDHEMLLRLNARRDWDLQVLSINSRT